jgi:hypothetical protein
MTATILVGQAQTSSRMVSEAQTGAAVTGTLATLHGNAVPFVVLTVYWMVCSNDSDATIYPGRAQTQYGPEIDHNCNGIYGVDSTVIPA